MFALKLNGFISDPTVQLVWAAVGFVSSLYYIYCHVRWLKNDYGEITVKDVIALSMFLVVGTLSGFILPLYMFMDYLHEKRVFDRHIYTKEKK